MQEDSFAISKARTVEEAAEFWDTHDTADYWDQMPEAHFEVRVRSKGQVTVAPDLFERLNDLSIKQGMTVTDLVNGWLTEKLSEQEDHLASATK